MNGQLRLRRISRKFLKTNGPKNWPSLYFNCVSDESKITLVFNKLKFVAKHIRRQYKKAEIFRRCFSMLRFKGIYIIYILGRFSRVNFTIPITIEFINRLALGSINHCEAFVRYGIWYQCWIMLRNYAIRSFWEPLSESKIPHFL